MKYIDIHSHLNFHEFDADREAVMARLAETETGTIVVGTDFETSKWAVDIADQYENVWACIGVHPVDDPKVIFEKEKFEELVKHPKVVAVGECGLDFHHAEKDKDFDRQKELFLVQINFAFQHNKPLMIHVRDAYKEALHIIEPLKKEYGDKLRGNMHFFAADLEVARKFWVLGFTTSFTGAITFQSGGQKGGWRDPNTYANVIRNAPIDMLMSETDAPFVAPVPYRGKRNEPSFVSEVVKKIAEIRDEDLETVQKALVSNASRLFKISA